MIAIGSDHGGYKLKEQLINYFKKNKIDFKDFGSDSEESVDYPDYGHAVSKAIMNKQAELGILICGTGNGINMAANKNIGIRSALCWTSEIAKLAREHNDANIMALPGRFIETKEAIKCVEAFINTRFEGGRHLNRINKIECT